MKIRYASWFLLLLSSVRLPADVNVDLPPCCPETHLAPRVLVVFSPLVHTPVPVKGP